MAYSNLADDEHKRLQRVWDTYENSGTIRFENGHYMWKKSSNNGYGRVGIKLNMKEGPTVQKMFYAHVLAYCLKDWTFNWDDRRKTKLDVSHLCGEKLCVSHEHLILESRGDNNARKKCHKRRHCFGHGLLKPKCIFRSKFIYLNKVHVI